MQTSALISETNLLRITVLKRKHASQIRERANAHPQTQIADCEILFHIKEWDAILCRRKDNGRFVIMAESAYYFQQLRPVNGAEISRKREEAREFLHQLPEIFLD